MWRCDTMASEQAPASPSMRLIASFFLIGLLAPPIAAQSAMEEFRIYTEHPRLLLRPQRLRLLKRERERQSMRWNQFNALVAGKAEMPEPGFALALYFAVSGDAATGKRAIEWALGPGSDLRQLALVYDWCQPLLSEPQARALTQKIRKALAVPATSQIIPQRNRIMAAISIAEQNQNEAEALIRDAVGKWWNGTLAARLNAGADLDPGNELQALLEILHVVRDNLTLDLRDTAPEYFKTLPAYEVICNYPAPLASTENEYRIPIFNGSGEPDLTRASLARAAGLSTVAYDTNALENQFLQGWLIQDRFILRGVFGAPYEFLWANPYQPGLSYAHLPLTLHDQRSGSLFLRSDWEEDAVWFALHDGQAQIYRDGRITVLAQKGPLGAKPEPIHVGKSSIVVSRDSLRFQADGDPVFIIGGKPRTQYDVEVDDEELVAVETDAAGTIELRFADRTPGVRVRMAAHLATQQANQEASHGRE